ncbi:uncharacterized protein LOC132737863 [Ruditapes philippinarum]|uniref:uncharacterized protein LOC132737863 n=1 Tax=Ruditapes philippinarum TaxID=129788 RepID=UPI00295B8D62|nr:uncharacterized protein LOC132737863 [Ruditapes philippinarum]
MKWLIVKLVFIAYILTLVSILMFFPEIGVTEDKSNEKCQREIDRIIQKYEHTLNQTVQNLKKEDHTEETSDEDIGPGSLGRDVDLSRVSLSDSEQGKRQKLLAQHDYDAFVSDLVSIYRVLPDTRPDVQVFRIVLKQNEQMHQSIVTHAVFPGCRKN